MKEHTRENLTNLKYSLHDAHINKFRIEDNSIFFDFDEGYYIITKDDALPIEGGLVFENVDFDFCGIYILDNDGSYGDFTGRKYAFHEFAKTVDKFDMEIIDETYGYNYSKFWGFAYVGEDIKEFIIDIYHFGRMKYLLGD